MEIVKAPKAFIHALQQRSMNCPISNCDGPVASRETSRKTDRVKSFELQCQRCNWHETLSGSAQTDPPWDEGSLMEIIEEHLLHLEPVCPFDQAPVYFHSLPNPRRRARYHIACFYCGREQELEWPPEEAKR